jgi:hypothetical protein
LRAEATRHRGELTARFGAHDRGPP